MISDKKLVVHRCPICNEIFPLAIANKYCSECERYRGFKKTIKSITVLQRGVDNGADKLVE